MKDYIEMLQLKYESIPTEDRLKFIRDISEIEDACFHPVMNIRSSSAHIGETVKTETEVQNPGIRKPIKNFLKVVKQGGDQ